ncbi:MAG: DMT family transporter [Clostridiales bacterium]|nr:DMT family transporter [Clostridiales bacterium]
MKKLPLYIILSALFFGTMEVALKLVGSNLDAFQITFLRFLIGGAFLFPFAIYESRQRPAGVMTWKLWLYMALLGVINVPIAMILFQYGVQESNAATAAVIFCINPVFTMLLSHVFTTDDRMNRRKALALAVGAAGLVFMIRPWDMQPGNTLHGVLMSISGAAVFGLFSVLGAKSLPRVGAFTQTSSTFLIGAAALAAVMPILSHPMFAGAGGEIPLILYVSLVVTGGGYLFYFLAVRASNASTAAIVFFLKPIIAPIFAVILLAEAITWNMYAGIGLILVASYILLFHKKKTP